LKLGAGGLTLLPPGSTAVLQGLVERIFGALPSNQMVSTFKAPAGDQPDLKINGLADQDQGKLTLTENNGGTEVEGQAAVEGPEDAPKKHRQRVELNVFQFNSLAPGNKGVNGAAQAGKDGGTTTTTPKHGLGFGKTPVQDLVKRVVGGLTGHDDDDGAAAGAGDPAPAAAS
jgi:hypothetical protein